MKFVQPVRDLDKIEEIKNVLKRKSLRNYFIFNIGINLGRRVSDILNLRARDLRNKDRLIIKEIKTGKETYLIIPKPLKKELSEYLSTYSDDDYIFRGKKNINKPLSCKRFYQIMKDISRIVSIDNLGTHTMRKTFGYHYYKMFPDVAELMVILNHREQSTTLRYIGVEQDKIDEKMKKFGL